ncbi:protein of unknown function [Salegentibacter agarivorans]|jgi:lipase chaperone LimK|uniref:DUF4174 domain-containing protein n=2 Tax=Salegentibacter TaxID=143222 RepID=A0A1I2NIH1_9FLAO|nr:MULTISPECIES: DUF4174 domain-containing protein [Salegentibacter]APS37899.1 hypothetical protein AO058_02945 [Salegentibacter sp. T436]SFG02609.1 protein of unknown function [Salegentibacter agarivorans]
MNLNAQDLSKHQWKDRLILIVAEQKNEKFQQQLTELQKHQQGLNERKLVIYQILPEKYTTGFEEENWKNSSELFQKYKAEKSDFRVILIGLDGGEKLEQTEVLSAEKLFNTIDSMPMRQAEIRKNK